MKTILKTCTLTLAAFSSLCTAQSDQDFDVSPTISYFGSVDLGSSSASSLITFKNTHSSDDLSVVGSATLGGEDGDQFTIINDNCNNATLTAGSSCTVELQYTPNKFGSHLAIVKLSVPGDAESPVMSAFLSSEEDTIKEAERRFPEIIHHLNLTQTHSAALDLTIDWSILGYSGGYTSTIALFDCSGIAQGLCGENFGDNIWNSGELAFTVSSLSNKWNYQGQKAGIFDYSAVVPSSAFSGLPVGATDVVVRFYSKSSNDSEAGLPSTSLVIPGSLGADYYDATGRRAKISVNN